MKRGPLTRLRQALQAKDNSAAMRVLRRTRWKNLTNALRALPPATQPAAYQLLDNEQTAEVADQLTTEEHETLQQAPSKKNSLKPPC
jgi:Mg/Co/Ni transporter MgtE